MKSGFELCNHLGNVIVTVSDRKLPKDTVGNNTVDHFRADVLSAGDYYAFGMQMPNRTYSASEYRFGFNGMEADNEIKSNNNSYDFGARIYDPRNCRLSSIDKYYNKYANWSPYTFGFNNPLSFLDENGDTIIIAKHFQSMFLKDVESIYGIGGSMLFSFNEQDQLQLSRAGKIILYLHQTLQTEKGKSLSALNELINSPENTEVVYQKSNILVDPFTGSIIRHWTFGPLQTLDEYGGEVTFTLFDNPGRDKNVIIIGTEKEVYEADLLDFNTMEKQHQTYPRANRLFHGFGHVLYQKPNEQENVIHFDNLNRRLSGKKEIIIDESHRNRN
jgi:RHS repeat-associated protein